MIEVGNIVEFKTVDGRKMEGIVVRSFYTLVIESDDYGTLGVDLRAMHLFMDVELADNKRYISRNADEVILISNSKHAKIKTEFLQGIDI